MDRRVDQVKDDAYGKTAALSLQERVWPVFGERCEIEAMAVVKRERTGISNGKGEKKGTWWVLIWCHTAMHEYTSATMIKAKLDRLRSSSDTSGIQ